MVTPGSAAGGADRLRRRSGPAAVGPRRLRLGRRTTRSCSARTASCGRCRRRQRQRRRGWPARWPTPAPSRCRRTARQIAFLRRGQIWLGNVAAGTRAAAHQPAGGARRRRAGVLGGRPLARLHRHRAAASSPRTCRGTARWCARWRTVTRERRLGVIAAQGGDVVVDPDGGRGQRRAVRRRRRRSSIRSCRPTARHARSRLTQRRRAAARALARPRRASGCRRPIATSSCWSRPTASRSRSSATAAAGFTST